MDAGELRMPKLTGGGRHAKHKPKAKQRKSAVTDDLSDTRQKHAPKLKIGRQTSIASKAEDEEETLSHASGSSEDSDDGPAPQAKAKAKAKMKAKAKAGGRLAAFGVEEPAYEEPKKGGRFQQFGVEEVPEPPVQMAPQASSESSPANQVATPSRKISAMMSAAAEEAQELEEPSPRPPAVQSEPSSGKAKMPKLGGRGKAKAKAKAIVIPATIPAAAAADMDDDPSYRAAPQARLKVMREDSSVQGTPQARQQVAGEPSVGTKATKALQDQFGAHFNEFDDTVFFGLDAETELTELKQTTNNLDNSWKAWEQNNKGTAERIVTPKAYILLMHESHTPSCPTGCLQHTWFLMRVLPTGRVRRPEELAVPAMAAIARRADEVFLFKRYADFQILDSTLRYQQEHRQWGSSTGIMDMPELPSQAVKAGGIRGWFGVLQSAKERDLADMLQTYISGILGQIPSVENEPSLQSWFNSNRVPETHPLLQQFLKESGGFYPGD